MLGLSTWFYESSLSSTFHCYLLFHYPTLPSHLLFCFQMQGKQSISGRLSCFTDGIKDKLCVLVPFFHFVHAILCICEVSSVTFQQKVYFKSGIKIFIKKVSGRMCAWNVFLWAIFSQCFISLCRNLRLIHLLYQTFFESAWYVFLYFPHQILAEDLLCLNLVSSIVHPIIEQRTLYPSLRDFFCSLINMINIYFFKLYLK